MTRRRVTTMAAVGAFVLVIAAVAVVAGRDGGGGKALPKLSFGAAGSSATTAMPSAAGPGDERAALAPFGRVTYVVRGTLPALEGTGPAFTVEPDAGRARVDRLAQALGVPADRVLVDPTDKPPAVSSGTVLLVFGGTWSLSTLSPSCSVSSDGTTGCASSGTSAPGGGSSSGGSAAGSSSSGAAGANTPRTTVGPDCPMPPCPPGAACAQVCPDPGSPATTIPTAPPTPPARPADLPSRAEAERVGRAVLEQAGVDLGGADVRVDDEVVAWSVTATPRAGGLPTIGLESTVIIGSKGAIVGGYGRLVKLTKIGDYPLAGSATGLERLKAGTFAGPVPLGASRPAITTGSGGAVAVAPPAPSSVEPSPPATGTVVPPGTVPVAPPATVVPQPIVVTITGVHLALASSFSAGGRDTLAPVYVFETDAKAGLSPVPAVTDALLAPAPEPAPAPAGKPTGVPGSAPASEPGRTP